MLTANLYILSSYNTELLVVSRACTLNNRKHAVFHAALNSADRTLTSKFSFVKLITTVNGV